MTADVAARSVRWPLQPLRDVGGMPVLFGIAYLLGAEGAFLVGTLSDKIFAPFWPPNVILFCGLLLAPERRWWLYIAAAFPFHVLAELHVGHAIRAGAAVDAEASRIATVGRVVAHQRLFEGARNRIFDQSFAQTDAQITGEQFHQILRLESGCF